jgi:hypothetical protein
LLFKKVVRFDAAKVERLQIFFVVIVADKDAVIFTDMDVVIVNYKKAEHCPLTVQIENNQHFIVDTTLPCRGGWSEEPFHVCRGKKYCIFLFFKILKNYLCRFKQCPNL